MDVSTTTNALSALGLGSVPTTESTPKELGQDAFLKLMLTQLKAQDPLKPMENGEFIAQLAQFSTVSGIEKLNGSFATLAQSLNANQAMQASQLVGRSVLTAGADVELDPAAGSTSTVSLPAMVPDLTLNLYDASGQLVRSMGMAGQGPGLVDVKWDGLDDAGEPLPAGRYRVEATGTLDGAAQAFETYVQRQVEGVSLDPEGGPPLLQVGTGETVGLDEVREIR